MTSQSLDSTLRDESIDESSSSTASATETTGKRPPTVDSEIGLDDVFEVAKNERRRRLLAELRRQDGPVPLGDLAEAIAARENDKSPHALTSDERKRVYVGLYQCHVPKMEGLGVVDATDRAGVTLAENAPVVCEWLDAAEADPVRWQLGYAGVVALAGAALVGAGLAGVASAPLTGVIVFCLLAGIGLVAALQSRSADSEDRAYPASVNSERSETSGPFGEL